MATQAFPSLEESLEILKALLKKAEKLTDDKGFETFKKRVMDGKFAHLGRYFGEDGRLAIEVTGEELVKPMDWNEAWKGVERDLGDAAYKLMSKPRFQTTLAKYWAADRAAHFLYDWFSTAHITPKQVADNAIPGKPSPTTQILKAVGEARSYKSPYSYSSVMRVDGDPNGRFGSCLYEHKELAVEFIQILASRLVELLKGLAGSQKNPLIAVLSINPLDLAMTTYHTRHYESCHNIVTGGHKTAGYSYALDNTTAIAFVYQKSTKLDFCDQFYPEKMWRALVPIDLKNLSGLIGRQYPTYMPGYSRFARRLLAQVLEKHGQVPFNWTVRRYAPGISASEVAGKFEYEEEDDGVSDKFKYTYAGHFTYHDHISEIVRMKPDGRPPSVVFGTDTIPCLKCGAEHNSPTRSFLCDTCQPVRIRCAHCANVYYSTDMTKLTYRNGQSVHLCKECVGSTIRTCKSCGEPHYYRHMAATTGESEIDTICPSCVAEESRGWVSCNGCGRYTRHTEKTIEGQQYCKSCLPSHTATCKKCERRYSKGSVDASGLCDICAVDLDELNDMLAEIELVLGEEA